MVADELKWSKK